jgi:transglutaminase-like putative cysteine protease
MIAMWIFFPRIATPFWSVPIDTSTASSGLSDRMSPGDISSLSLSNAVAFRVKFQDAMPPPHKRYWRGLVLNRFNGRTWTGSEPTFSRNRRDDIEYEGDPVNYQVTLEPTRQQWIFALDIPFDADLDRTFMDSGHQLARMQPVDQRVVYNATSYPDFRMSNNLNEFWRDRFTNLPEDTNQRSVQLAREMRDRAGSNETFINNVLRMFNREDFYYTLEPPALGGNPVDEFLFDSRRGFCEHYASAFAVMMRAAGIPSRIVLGYQGGEVNPVGDYLTVRQADAHAWTEVWLRGRGWYRVDPTAAVAPERIEMGRYGAMMDGIGESWGLTAPSQWAYRIEMTWDAMNARWNEWILAYGPENQGQFMRWLGMEDPDWRQMMLTLIAISVFLIALVSLHLMMRYRPPQKDEAARLYSKFIGATGVEMRAGESPLAYSARLATEKAGISDAAAGITDLYLDTRYGPPDPAAVPELRSAVSGFTGRNRP